MVDEHFSFEVVIFVLEYSCFESFKPSFLLFAVFVDVVDEDFFWALYAFIDAWY